MPPRAHGVGRPIALVALPPDPRDLYGWMMASCQEAGVAAWGGAGGASGGVYGALTNTDAGRGSPLPEGGGEPACAQAPTRPIISCARREALDLFQRRRLQEHHDAPLLERIGHAVIGLAVGDHGEDHALPGEEILELLDGRRLGVVQLLHVVEHHARPGVDRGDDRVDHVLEHLALERQRPLAQLGADALRFLVVRVNTTRSRSCSAAMSGVARLASRRWTVSCECADGRRWSSTRPIRRVRPFSGRCPTRR